ncbi:MAG: hypothetical protein ACTHZI_01555 [Luteimonas sp.]
MQEHTYRIDPVRAESVLESQLTEVLEGIPGWSADEWDDVPGKIIGWQLSFIRDRQTIEQRNFEGTDAGFDQAIEVGKAWLATNGADSTSQWIAGSLEAMRRMSFDPDFRHRISKRGF